MAVDFDVVLEEVGGMGRYQLSLYLLLCVPASVPAAFLAFNQVFLSAVPDHWCWEPALDHLEPAERRRLAVPLENRDGEEQFSHCSMYQVNWTQVALESGGVLPAEPNTSWPRSSCAWGWEYNRTLYQETLATEMNLVCERDWLPSFCTTLFYTGSLFGNLIFGWIADRWGRRTSFFVILFLEVPLSVATAFSPNYEVYTALRTVAGLCFPALFQVPFILSLELMGPEYRTFAGMVICIFFAAALALLAGLAYLLRHWFTLALATSLPSVLLFGYWWVVPESPRWLLSKHRYDEAEEVVLTMAKMNGRPIKLQSLRALIRPEDDDGLTIVPGSEEKNTSVTKSVSLRKFRSIDPEEPKAVTVVTPLAHEEVTERTVTPLDLAKYPGILRNLCIITFNWLANSVVYNGLSYNTTNLGVSDYLAFFFSAIVEVPSYLVCWYAMDRLGRRWVLCSTMMVGGIACISAICVPPVHVWVTVTLAMIGKFGIAGSFAVIYVFAGELLPTVVRSQAMGAASFVAGLGLLAFPYIVYLGVYHRVLPLIIMGILSLAGAFSAFVLPETLNAHLPQTLEEGEAFSSTDWSCFCGGGKVKRRKPASSTETVANGVLMSDSPTPTKRMMENGVANGIAGCTTQV